MTVSKQTRLGTRVRFIGHSFAYTDPPAKGEEGEVTYMPGYKPKTYLPGPGGGLLYVKWDRHGVMGVSPNDLEKASGRGLGGPSKPKKIYALDPREREKECKHSMGFPYKGRIPNTGPQVCPMCGTRKEDVEGFSSAEADEDGPWTKLSYGDLPKRDVFMRHYKRALGTKLYEMELVDRDVDAIDHCFALVNSRYENVHTFGGEYGKQGIRLDADALYALLKCIVEQYESAEEVSDEERSYGPKRGKKQDALHRAEQAMDLASSILQTLNIEWV